MRTTGDCRDSACTAPGHRPVSAPSCVASMSGTRRAMSPAGRQPPRSSADGEGHRGKPARRNRLGRESRPRRTGDLRRRDREACSKTLPVGAGAHDICISERAGKAYITAETINAVTTVDIETLATESIPVGPLPHHFEPSHDGRTIYVTLASHTAGGRDAAICGDRHRRQLGQLRARPATTRWRARTVRTLARRRHAVCRPRRRRRGLRRRHRDRRFRSHRIDREGGGSDRDPVRPPAVGRRRVATGRSSASILTPTPSPPRFRLAFNPSR